MLSIRSEQLFCSRDPNNIKYRAVKLSNKTIEEKLLTANGAFEVGGQTDYDNVFTAQIVYHFRRI